MDKKLDLWTIIQSLTEVPAFQPRLLELTKQLVKEDGSIDPHKVAFHQIELEQAIGEARAYLKSTQEAVNCLMSLIRS